MLVWVHQVILVGSWVVLQQKQHSLAPILHHKRCNWGVPCRLVRACTASLSKAPCSGLLPALHLNIPAAVRVQEVPVLVAQAAETLQQALDPADTCTLLGACATGSQAKLLGLTAEQVRYAVWGSCDGHSSVPTSASTKLPTAVPSGFMLPLQRSISSRMTRVHTLPLSPQASSPWDCPVCKMVVVAFVQRLQDRQERQQIEADMRAACDNLSPEAKVRGLGSCA